MSTEAVIAIVVVVALVVAAVGVWLWANSRRSRSLRERFGSEYERRVREDGRSRAERELAEREKRVEKLRLKELAPDQRRGYSEEWQRVQARFVDEPEAAILEADDLVQKVMDARGYPLAGFERQRDDISVDHPDVVRNYEAGHAIAGKARQHAASTEDLRQGMLHYRALFSDLLGVPATV